MDEDQKHLEAAIKQSEDGFFKVMYPMIFISGFLLLLIFIMIMTGRI
jgi:hypothetical protein